MAEALEIAALGKAINRRVKTYSQGMRQRLAIAQAMLGLPDLLLLDEPTNGLDPPQIHAMREVLRGYAAAGRTVLVSSHMLSEVEQTCSHVVVVHQGRTIAAGTVADLVSASGDMVFAVDDEAAALTVLSSLPGIGEAELDDPDADRSDSGGVIRVDLGSARAADAVRALVVRRGGCANRSAAESPGGRLPRTGRRGRTARFRLARSIARVVPRRWTPARRETFYEQGGKYRRPHCWRFPMTDAQSRSARPVERHDHSADAAAHAMATMAAPPTATPSGVPVGFSPGRTLPVRVELMRQLRRRRTQLSLGLMVALPIILLVAFSVGSSNGNSNSTGTSFVDLAKSGAANFAMVSLFFSASFLLIVVISLFFGDTIASEASWSSLRYLLTMPVPRLRLLRQKILVAGLLSVAALVILPTTAYVVGLIAYGSGPLSTPIGDEFGTGAGLVRLLVVVGYLAIQLTWVAGLAFLLSVVTDAPLGAVGGGRSAVDPLADPRSDHGVGPGSGIGSRRTIHWRGQELWSTRSGGTTWFGGRSRGSPTPWCSSSLRSCGSGARTSPAERGLLHAELVAFRVEKHHPAVAPFAFALFHDRGPRPDQTFHVSLHRFPTNLGIGDAVSDTDVDVQTVLHLLALRHLLEVDPRPGAMRVDDGAGIVPTLGRKIRGRQSLLPGLEPRRRIVELITESHRPELGEHGRALRVDDDLHLHGTAHAISLFGTRPARVNDRTRGPGQRAPTPAESMSPDLLLQFVDLVPQPTSEFELQLAGRGHHLIGELLDQIGQFRPCHPGRRVTGEHARTPADLTRGLPSAGTVPTGSAELDLGTGRRVRCVFCLCIDLRQDVVDLLPQRLWIESDLEVVGDLLLPPPVGLLDGPRHRRGDLVRIHVDLPVDVASGTTDGLDQRGAGPEESLLVGVEDGDE